MRRVIKNDRSIRFLITARPTGLLADATGARKIKYLECGGQGRNRTTDTRIFSRG